MIIFVCTGNTCRSPLAESYAKTVTDREVESRGLFVTSNQVSPYSEEIIQRENYSPSTLPKQLTYEDTLDNTLLVMTKSHYIQVKMLNEDADVHLLSEYAGESGDVLDPFGGNMDDYTRVFHQMKQYIDKINW
uniref:arsenate reductase/protein-tyrosine-phosphatase family protein n=1 Tax=Nosocomiicoccus ampullae TaxID=489910 RepID=UPI000831B813|nr:hypothetical protein [Nosocomiicoccus ampullae]